MTRYFQMVRKWDFWKDEQGQDLIEYALMIAFVAVSAVVFIPAVVGKISAVFSKVGSELDGAI